MTTLFQLPRRSFNSTLLMLYRQREERWRAKFLREIEDLTAYRNGGSWTAFNEVIEFAVEYVMHALETEPESIPYARTVRDAGYAILIEADNYRYPSSPDRRLHLPAISRETYNAARRAHYAAMRWADAIGALALAERRENPLHHV